jgi:serine/threonine-protein kinase
MHSRETIATLHATPRSAPRPAASRVAATSFDEVFPTLPGSTPRSGPASGSETFGEYLLVELLGRGGMAQVYRAQRRGEQFALKRPLLSCLDEAEFLERFLREADLGRALHHPNIVRIFERGEVEGVPYFTMELIAGETLHARLRRGPLPVLEATDLVCQVAEALDYAHLKGIVHRDLKPSNIMILGGGVVKVMDYGIARARRYEGLTATGAFLGTPEYAAPESAEGLGWDSRSDLYSLGVTFYESLTGRKPFVGETPYATMRMHCTEAPAPPSALTPVIPRAVESVVLRLLAKKPEERHASAEELLVELRDYLTRADRAV